eukprot:1115711-Rhodomonas_salina.3
MLGQYRASHRQVAYPEPKCLDTLSIRTASGPLASMPGSSIPQFSSTMVAADPRSVPDTAQQHTL